MSSTDRRITRRTLIGTAAVAAGAAALPTDSEAGQAHGRHPRGNRQRTCGPLKADVVVDGAGLSGLTAARHVKAAEPWTRGSFVGYTPPGVLTDYGPWIRAPFGRIHWAGAETSDYWSGYMDGAIRSGERAAGEALADL
jgi:monoamine oxidase